MRALLSGIAMIALGCGGGSHTGAAGDAASRPTDVANPDAPPPDAWSPTLGIAWAPAGDNPVIGDGACPGWHCIAATDPAIARAADGSLAVWFTTVGIEPEGSGYSSVLDIGRASGSDGATIALSVTDTAAVLASPAATPAWDTYAETWSVRRDADTWTAWFLGYSAPGFVGAGIGQMQSLDADGTQWERPAAPIYQPSAGAWDAALVSGPTEVRGPDGVDRVYYSGVGADGASVGMLTSTDGATWTPAPTNPVFPHGPAGAWDSTILEQTVRYADGRYWMWYSAYADAALADSTSIAIGLATSTDGVTWERSAANPVLSPGATGAWNDLRVLAPDVLVDDDGSFLMAAYGQASADPANDEPGRIGLWRSR